MAEKDFQFYLGKVRQTLIAEDLEVDIKPILTAVKGATKRYNLTINAFGKDIFVRDIDHDKPLVVTDDTPVKKIFEEVERVVKRLRGGSNDAKNVPMLSLDAKLTLDKKLEGKKVKDIVKPGNAVELSVASAGSGKNMWVLTLA